MKSLSCILALAGCALAPSLALAAAPPPAPPAAASVNPGAGLVPPVPAASEAPSLEWVFSEVVTVNFAGPPAGKTYNGQRRIIPITGGVFSGPNIKGQVLPGGWDYQAVRSDGCTSVSATYFLQTDDGVIINIRNEGAICPGENGGPAPPTRTTPVFEAPAGKYEWLNKASFVGTLTSSPAYPNAVVIGIYRAK